MRRWPLVGLAGALVIGAAQQGCGVADEPAAERSASVAQPIAVGTVHVMPPGAANGAQAERAKQKPNIGARDDGDTIAVWLNERPTLGRWDVHATRLSEAGEVLDPGGILAGVDANPAITPAVSFSGTTSLVVWADANLQLRGARIAQDGTPLDSPDGAVIAALPLARDVALASDGDGWLVAYGGGDAMMKEPLLLQRVDGSGQPMGGAWSVGPSGDLFDIAWGGADYVVAYVTPQPEDLDRVERHLVDPTSGPGVAPLVLSNVDTTALPGVPFRSLHAMTNTTGSAVMWTQASGLELKLRARFLDAAGAPTGSDPLDVTPGPLGVSAAPARMSYDPATDAYAYNATIFLQTPFGTPPSIEHRFGRAGDTLTTLVPFGIGVPVPTAAAHLVRPTGNQIRLGLFDLSNSPVTFGITPIISTRLAHQRRARAAGGPTGALIVWDEDGDVRGCRVDTDGAAIDTESLAIAVSPHAQVDPAVARGDDGWLVAWADAFDPAASGGEQKMHIARRLVHDDGTLGEVIRGTVGIDDARAPSVLWEGDGFSIAWTEGPDSGRRLMVRRVGPSGVFLDVPAAVKAAGNGSQNNANPKLFSLEGVRHIAWAQERSGTSWDILAARVDGSEAVEVASFLSAQTAPAVASDGTTALLAWRDERFSQPRVHGALLRGGSDLIIVEPDVELTTSESTDHDVAYTNDGHEFALVWAGPDADGVGRGAAVGVFDDGTVAGPPTPLTGSPENVRQPAVASVGSAGRALAVFSRVWGPPFTADRVMTTALSTGSLDGVACGEASECASGHCVDGVCCDVACDGVCQTCSDVAGQCKVVLNARDPDTCDNFNTCDETGLCRAVNGLPCTNDDQCASGFCVENVCCESACDEGCFVCNQPSTAGQCTPMDCGAYACTGLRECALECVSSEECAEGFQCFDDGVCREPPQPVAPPASCAIGAKDSESPAWWLVPFGLAWARRRRRSPREAARRG